MRVYPCAVPARVLGLGPHGVDDEPTEPEEDGSKREAEPKANVVVVVLVVVVMVVVVVVETPCNQIADRLRPV